MQPPSYGVKVMGSESGARVNFTLTPELTPELVVHSGTVDFPLSGGVEAVTLLSIVALFDTW